MADVGDVYANNGFPVVPIIPPGSIDWDGKVHYGAGKAPGERVSEGQWKGLSKWQQFGNERYPTVCEVGKWGAEWGAEVGIVMGRGLYAIDFDYDVDGSHAVMKEVLKAAGCVPTLVKTGRKGETWLILDPDGVTEAKTQWKVNGVVVADFLGVGTQTVMPPSRHADGEHEYRFTTGGLHVTTMDLVRFQGSLAIQLIDNCGVVWDRKAVKDSKGCVGGAPIRKLKDALRYVSATCDYQTWLSVCFALYNETGGSAEGFELWDSWSATGNGYNLTEVSSKWKSASTNMNGKSGKSCHTIYDMAVKGGWSESKFVLGGDKMEWLESVEWDASTRIRKIMEREACRL
jgi:hypothetical protein